MSSEAFETLESEKTQTFEIESTSLPTDAGCDDYLRMAIGQPLSDALAFVIIHRPEDAIEFITQYLIDWSRKKTRQVSIDREENDARALIEMDLQQQAEVERQQKQRQELFLEYDQHVYRSFHGNFPIDPRTDDEREPTSKFPKEVEQISHPPLVHRVPRPTLIHPHETGSGSEDQTHSAPATGRCQEGDRSSLPYFSQLKERIIQCDNS